METKPDNGAALWNGTAASAWIDLRELLDTMFQPIETMLAAAVEPGQHVLDVGCGTGSTTLALARRTGHCTGADISAPMIALAQARAGAEGIPATFLCADAQRHRFEAGSFEAIVSRFGVMFFDDPAAAFANLRHAARPGAALRFFAWRSPQENPFMTAAERAVGTLLAQYTPPRQPDDPGQFAFARAERVRAILDDAGWRDIRIEPHDVICTFSASDLPRYAAMMGPVGRVLPQLDAATREAMAAKVLAAFEPFVDGDTARYTAACWEVTATAPSS